MAQQLLQLLLFFAIVAQFDVTCLNCCSNCCFLFEKCAREGLLSGSRWPDPVTVGLALESTFFLSVFLCDSLLQKHMCHEIGTQNGSRIHAKPDLGPIFVDFGDLLFLNDPTMVLLRFKASMC